VDKIRIAMPHRGAGVAPIFAALEAGYYREQGLEPELVPFHGHSNSLKGLIAGEADFTNAVGAELLLANARYKGDAVILASAISRSAQQVAARPGIETREDLRGKRWGVGARNDADGLKWAELHADIIRRFSRFPHRNAVLGRVSTPEEQKFLDDGGFAG